MKSDFGVAIDDDFNFCSVDLEGLLSGVSMLGFLKGEEISGPVVFPTHIVNGDLCSY